MLNLRILPRSRNLIKKSVCAYSSNTGNGPEKTSLYNFHVAKKGKMVDFAGDKNCAKLKWINT